MNLALGLTIGGIILTVLLILGFLSRIYKRIQNTAEALVITRYGSKGKEAVIGGAFVVPLLNDYERISLQQHSIPIKREFSKDGRGEESEGLPCKDNIRADISVMFYIGINPDPEDILLAASKLTCAVASDTKALTAYFTPKFSEALKTAIKKFDFVQLLESRVEFRDAVKQLLVNDLEGFKLHDVVIDKIEQSPLEAHNPNNILDAEGIRKITSITAEKNIETTQIRENERTETKKRSVEGETARLQLNKNLTEETEKTEREIAKIKIEEKKNIDIAGEAARLETEKVRIETDQQISISEENKDREVNVVQIANEKVVEIQREQVERAKKVETVLTEREVAEKSLEKDKIVETAKRDNASIIAERTKTEREIAVEEEQTKDIRVKSSVERDKLEVVTRSQAEAQAEAVKAVTRSETELTATKNNVQKDTLLADNKLVIASKDAEAKERLATASRVEKAAVGLAEADVREKLAEVKKLEASAESEQVKLVGLAEVEVKSKDAEAVEKMGRAEATRVREMGLAEAESSEASYKAMASIQPEVRQHELDKLEIERNKAVQIATVEASKDIARSNAEVLAAAMSKAEIKMIGGGDMFDNIRNSIVSSEALDARYQSSDVLKGLFGNYVEGDRDLMQDLKDVLQKSEVSTGAVGDLALAQGLIGLLKKSPQGSTFIEQILKSVKQ